MLTPAILTFTAIVGLADMQGWGHGYGGLLLLVGWYFFLRSCEPQNQNRIVAALLIVSIFMLPLCIAQIWVMPRARGIFVSPNFLGGYAALNIFLTLELAHRLNLATCLNDTNSWKVGLFVSANAMMLLLSQSRGAMVAAVIGGSLTIPSTKPRLRAGLLFVGVTVIAAASLIRTSDSISPRFDIWQMAWNGALMRPLLGWGQNGLLLGITGVTSYYSIPLEWFVNAGVLGVLAGAGVLWEAWRGADNSSRAFLAVWFVNGLFMFTRPETSFALFTVLALLKRRDVNRLAVVIQHDQPLLDRRVRAKRPNRRHRGGDRPVGDEAR